MKLNKEYKEIARDILENENYLPLKNDIHHGTNRYSHCNRVAYLSFLMAKLFKGDQISAVKAGLLHDFFFGSSKHYEENSYLNHPQTSINNAERYFEITDHEKEIIKTHMYHYVVLQNMLPLKKERFDLKKYKPKSKEGIIVCISDLLVSIFECGLFEVRYCVCLYLLFLINVVRY